MYGSKSSINVRRVYGFSIAQVVRVVILFYLIIEELPHRMPNYSAIWNSLAAYGTIYCALTLLS